MAPDDARFDETIVVLIAGEKMRNLCRVERPVALRHALTPVLSRKAGGDDSDSLPQLGFVNEAANRYFSLVR